MKPILIASCALLLSACSGTPVFQSSFNGYGYSMGPTSASDPRLSQPRFYMDEGDSLPPSLKAAPLNNR
ncbi:MAG TPA: hypothetical protein VHA82_10290 [Ramlibacter sp.]|uniref:hypothetical protein n=1 Tax=Ramlibacter sp. TaxID=1917967 RepID=UPI002C3CFD86|nr:hypothetical protein [Ramlibacter sp.]HVZ44185.1 hypothetical protein [Ramlibacter sp.]